MLWGARTRHGERRGGGADVLSHETGEELGTLSGRRQPAGLGRRRLRQDVLALRPLQISVLQPATAPTPQQAAPWYLPNRTGERRGEAPPSSCRS